MKNIAVLCWIISVFPLVVGIRAFATGEVSGKNLTKGRDGPDLVGKEAHKAGMLWLAAGGVMCLIGGVLYWLGDATESN